MKHYTVVGSLNMDLVTRVEHFPKPGETLRGSAFSIFPGGKGANQAFALNRLGCNVEMIGALGEDWLGAQYLQYLKTTSIGISGIGVLSDIATGTASIEVDRNGENQIIIVGGANDEVTPDFLRQNHSVVDTAECILLQLEIPLETIDLVLEKALVQGQPVILDPAPAQELPTNWFSRVAYLTPNQTEARVLTGIDTSTEEGIFRAGEELLARGVKCVIVKAGARGAYVFGPCPTILIPGFAVNTVDTVAAGDSFNAGLACALGDGLEVRDAVRFANAVAAISTTKPGAQTAMPTRAEVEAFLARQMTAVRNKLGECFYEQGQ